MVSRKGIQESKLVFYTGETEADAKGFFAANSDYAYFYDIFNQDFQRDFGGADMDSEVIAACSQAMAIYAEGEPLVLGDANDSDLGHWKSIEKPILIENRFVSKIWSMRDGTKDRNDHPGGDLKAGTKTTPKRVLNILSQYKAKSQTLDWLFLTTDYGNGVGCRTDFLIPPTTRPWAPRGALTYPGGTWDLTIDEKKCEYKNSGDKELDIYICGGIYNRQPVFTCAY